MKNRLQITLVIVLCVAAIAAVAVIGWHWSSGGPRTAKARVVAPKLMPAEFAFVNDPNAPEHSPAQFMIVRKTNGQTDVWRLQGKDGVVQMPEVRGRYVGRPCQRFAPDFIMGRIACRDSSLGEAARYFEWDMDGRNVIGQADDLKAAEEFLSVGE